MLTILAGEAVNEPTDDAAESGIEAPAVEANTQQVYVSQSTLADGKLTLTISYQADVANTTGVGTSI